MVNYEAPLYQHPPETWDEAKCKKLCKRQYVDGYGGKWPFKGYVSDYILGYPGIYFGLVIHYNGGCIRDGEWWQGEERHLPIVPPEYEIVHVPTWGYRIVKKGKADEPHRKSSRTKPRNPEYAEKS